MIRACMIALTLLVAGCAGYTAKSDVNNNENESVLAGIRYYQPAKYLLVYTDNQGNVTSEMLILPDLTKKVSIKPYAYLSSNNMTLTFTNGMLDQSVFEIDQTVVPKAVISSLEKVAAAATKSGVFLEPKKAGKRATVPAPYLFKLENENGKWKLIGGQGRSPDGESIDINVKLTAPKEQGQ